MTQAVLTTDAARTAEEWRFVSALRELPPGPLRERFVAFVVELAAVVGDPHCAERQADGAPCMVVSLDCEQCQQVETLLASLQRRVRRG